MLSGVWQFPMTFEPSATTPRQLGTRNVTRKTKKVQRGVETSFLWIDERLMTLQDTLREKSADRFARIPKGIDARPRFA